jgi:hypothetical protein
MQNRFCLLMIVRDEEVIIERCLTSIKNIFDTYIICDTGSKDNTIKVIQDFMDKNQKTGEIIKNEWKSFGHNKSYLLKYFKHESKFSDAEYIMWLDADEVFIRNKDDNLSYLTENDANSLYNILQGAYENIFMFPTLYCGLEYDRWQIARNNQDYRWDYPVQEAFVGNDNNTQFYTNFFYNLSRKEGNSSRNSRHPSDISMLEDYLKENPNEPRCTFYLAQAHNDVKLAIEYYKKRLELGGYIEEKYISCLRLGRLSSDEYDKVYYWLKAIDISPGRIETIYELMMLYHNKRDFRRASTYGKLANDDRQLSKILFQERDIYNYLFDFYFALSLYYNNEYDKAYEVGKKTIERINLFPPHLIEQARKNVSFYEAKATPVKTDINTDTRSITDVNSIVEPVKSITTKILAEHVANLLNRHKKNNNIMNNNTTNNDITNNDTTNNDTTNNDITNQDIEKIISQSFDQNINDNSNQNQTIEVIPFENKNVSPVKKPTPLPTVIVIDDFFENPDEIRRFALSQEFNVKGNYPGGRTNSFATDQDKQKFEQIIGRKITYFPGGYNGSYQVVTGKNTSWIHRDQTDYSVVVFLTPNPPPHGGTILYKHINSGLEKTSNESEENMLNTDSYNENNWHQMDRIGNKYNRAIIFQGKRSHKSDEYFGHDMETGRLFQTFFFNVE